jgi:hypothetical protein
MSAHPRNLLALCLAAGLFLLATAPANAQGVLIRAKGGLMLHMDRTDTGAQASTGPVRAGSDYLSIYDFHDATSGRYDADLAFELPWESTGSLLRFGVSAGRKQTSADEEFSEAALQYGQSITATQVLGFGEWAFPLDAVRPLIHLGVGARWYEGETTFNGNELTIEYETGPMVRFGGGIEFPLSANDRFAFGLVGYVDYATTEPTSIQGGGQTVDVTNAERLFDPAFVFEASLSYSVGGF